VWHQVFSTASTIKQTDACWRCRMLGQKTLPWERQRGTEAIANKQGNAKIGFQSLYACAHCRLGNMQSIGRFQKAAIGDYTQKSTNLINVYSLVSDMPILMSNKYKPLRKCVDKLRRMLNTQSKTMG
jgi:hypothetical protein